VKLMSQTPVCTAAEKMGTTQGEAAAAADDDDLVMIQQYGQAWGHLHG
jgi:hypothetical protein